VRARFARAGRLGALLLLAGTVQATPVHASADQPEFVVVGAPADRRDMQIRLLLVRLKTG